MANKQNNEDRLSVTIDPQGRMVHLRELKRLIEDLMACLNHISKEELDIRSQTDFSITGLEVGSAKVEVEPEAKTEISGARTLRRFHDIVGILASDLEIEPVLPSTLESVRKLALPATHITNRMFFNERQITTQFIANIDKRLNKDVVRSYGQLKGLLCEVQVRNKNEFFILPPISTKKIRCGFSDNLLPVVGDALKKSVTVSGVMMYRGNDAFPYQIQAERIEVHPPKEELPTLQDLRGIAPDLTGGLPSLEFLGGLRVD